MIKYSVLASGSTGNSIYIGTTNVNLLIDAGLSAKRIAASLQQIGMSIDCIDGILVTHEHDDHVRGLGVLARRHNIPIYANSKTMEKLPNSLGVIDEACKKIITTGEPINFADLLVESFPISHDAAEPVGYIFRLEDKKLVVVTDLGYVSQRIKEKLKGANVYIIEANHDVGMVRMSTYPWSVKQRILSDVGHLSNEASGEALIELITEATEEIYLAHLSKENNMQELARLAVKNILDEHGITADQVRLMNTYPDKPTKLAVIEDKTQKLAL